MFQHNLSGVTGKPALKLEILDLPTYSPKVSLVNAEHRKPCQPLADMHWMFCIEDIHCSFTCSQLESKGSLGETSPHIRSTKKIAKKPKQNTCMKPL